MCRLKVSASLVLTLGLALSLTVPTFCQTQVLGKISGTISDKSGAVIPGAKITATNKDTQLTSTTTTNDAGYYVLANLAAGTYDVSAEKRRLSALREYRRDP